MKYSYILLFLISFILTACSGSNTLKTQNPVKTVKVSNSSNTVKAEYAAHEDGMRIILHNFDNVYMLCNVAHADGTFVKTDAVYISPYDKSISFWRREDSPAIECKSFSPTFEHAKVNSIIKVANANSSLLLNTVRLSPNNSYAYFTNTVENPRPISCEVIHVDYSRETYTLKLADMLFLENFETVTSLKCSI